MSQEGVFQEIRVHFLPVGHTHIKIDQRFSRVSVKLQAVDTLTLPQLMNEVAALFHSAGSVYHESIPNTGDFWSIFNKHACMAVHGVATSRTDKGKVDVKVLRFFKDPSGRPVFVYRQYDESTQDKWSGHHRSDEPLCMFKHGRIMWPQIIKVAPREPIQNLSDIKAKVAALTALTPPNTNGNVQQEGPTLRVAEKVADYKTWWDSVFEEEEAFWSQHDASAPPEERRCPTSRYWATPVNLEGPAQVLQMTDARYLDASHIRPGNWSSDLVDKAHSALKASQDDVPIGQQVRVQTHTLVWVGNDRPQHKELYKPEEDLREDDIALVLYEPPNTPQERGWEIVKIKRVDHEGGTFDHIFLRPNRNRVDGQTGNWLPNWHQATLIQVGDPHNSRMPYTASAVDMQCVIWSLRTSNASPLRVPKASWAPLMEQIDLAERMWESSWQPDAILDATDLVRISEQIRRRAAGEAPRDEDAEDPWGEE